MKLQTKFSVEIKPIDWFWVITIGILSTFLIKGDTEKAISFFKILIPIFLAKGLELFKKRNRKE